MSEVYFHPGSGPRSTKEDHGEKCTCLPCYDRRRKEQEAKAAEIERLRAEHERFRAALYDIGYQASYIGLYSEGWARECARKALEAKHE